MNDTEAAKYADLAYDSFNKRFWYDDGGYLFDVIDVHRLDQRGVQCH